MLKFWKINEYFGVRLVVNGWVIISKIKKQFSVCVHACVRVSAWPTDQDWISFSVLNFISMISDDDIYYYWCFQFPKELWLKVATCWDLDKMPYLLQNSSIKFEFFFLKFRSILLTNVKYTRLFTYVRFATVYVCHRCGCGNVEKRGKRVIQLN